MLYRPEIKIVHHGIDLDQGALEMFPIRSVRVEKERNMSLRIRCISFTMILALTAAGAFAQTAATPPATGGAPTPPTQGMPMGAMPGGWSGMEMGGMPMMGMMQMMGQHGMSGHVEGRIAFLKTELKITDSQQPLWNAVADAMRATAKDIGAMPNCMSMMQSMMQQQSSTLPEKLASRENALMAHLEALRKLKTAVEPLYAVFSDDQKKTADQLMIGPMGIIGMGMM